MSQQDQSRDSIVAECLDDLPLTKEQADQTKAGNQALWGEGKKVRIDFCK